MRLVAAGEWVAGSALYGLVLGSKLNFITFLPAWVWACFHSGPAHWRHGSAPTQWRFAGGLLRAVGGLAIVVVTQV